MRTYNNDFHSLNGKSSMLQDAVKDLDFESAAVGSATDVRGRYRLDLDSRFPMAVKLFSFGDVDGNYPLNWHERLELFAPVSGTGRFRMGGRVLDFGAGDVIVVDNLKLHGLAEFRGPKRHAVVVTFAPEMVYTLGAPLCDFVLLSPFYTQPEEPVLHSDAPASGPLHRALERLTSCYFEPADPMTTWAGCKAYLLEALYHIRKHFGPTEAARVVCLEQQRRARRLGRLFEFIRDEFGEKITVDQAAALVGMDSTQFMKFFKKATGTTFVAYLTQVRLTNAYRLLRESQFSIAEIASMTGFTDQSYFDRQFRRHFHISPRELRAPRSAL